MIINFDLQTIGYYNEDFKTENGPTNEDINNSNNIIFTQKFLIIIILVIIILIIASTITSYFIGNI